MSNKMITNAISAVLAIGLGGLSAHAWSNAPEAQMNASAMLADVAGMEKCYGVAKAGHNDCGTATHTCAGEAKTDKDQAEWIQMPTGLCNKIAGSQLKVPEKT